MCKGKLLEMTKKKILETLNPAQLIKEKSLRYLSSTGTDHRNQTDQKKTFTNGLQKLDSENLGIQEVTTATRGVLYKKVFLEISQNSQENTCTRVSFLIKLQARSWTGASVTTVQNCFFTIKI